MDLLCLRLGATDGLVEIFPLLAALRTELCQLRSILARLGEIAGLDEQLALIFKRALVVGVEFECLGVKGHGHLPIAALAQAESEKAVEVGMLDALVDHPLELAD